MRLSAQTTPRRRARLHPSPIRLMHWINAMAMIVMIASGWKIYNDEVIFGWLHFPQQIVLGIWAQHALQWHFAMMWVIVLNGLAYLIYGFASGRFRRKFFPIRPRDVVTEVLDALAFRLRHDDLTVYNAVQRLLYVGVILVAIFQVFTGLAIWKPVQFQELVSAFGGFQGARLAHFIGMTLIVLFLGIHVTLAMLVPQTLLSMVTGGPPVTPAPGSSPRSSASTPTYP